MNSLEVRNHGISLEKVGYEEGSDSSKLHDLTINLHY